MLENAGDQVVINFNFVSDSKLSFFLVDNWNLDVHPISGLCGYLFLHDDVLQFWMTCLSFNNLRNLLFTGRVRLGANQNWSAHGTPRRMDGQLGCNFNGFPSSEKKKHNSGNKISVDQSWYSLSCFHKFPLIDLLRSVNFIQINFWIYWFLIKLQNDTIKRTHFRTFGIEIKRT